MLTNPYKHACLGLNIADLFITNRVLLCDFSDNTFTHLLQLLFILLCLSITSRSRTSSSIIWWALHVLSPVLRQALRKMNGSAVFEGIRLRQIKRLPSSYLAYPMSIETRRGSALCPVALPTSNFLARKTCCPRRYLQRPAFLKNLLRGHAKVFRETESCSPVGIKFSLSLPVELFGPSLDYFVTKGFRNVLKGVFLCSNVLFKPSHCNVLIDAIRLWVSSSTDSSGDLTGFTRPGSSAAKQVLSFFTDSLFPCDPL